MRRCDRGGAMAPLREPNPRGEREMEYFRENGLVRPRQGRVIAGVCAGLGRRFGISPFAARVLFVVVLLILPGSQLIVYPI
jgi:phage shock protein C